MGSAETGLDARDLLLTLARADASSRLFGGPKGSALEMEVHQAPSPRRSEVTERTAGAPAQANATQATEAGE
jgi:hypothetical protein